MTTYEKNAMHAKHVQEGSRTTFGRRVASGVVRAGMSAALIAPSLFVGIGSAHAAEGTAATQCDFGQTVVQASGESPAPQSAEQALDNLAAAESAMRDREAEYAQAKADVDEAKAAASDAKRQLEQATERRAEAEGALKKAEESASAVTEEDVATAAIDLQNALEAESRAKDEVQRLTDETAAAQGELALARGRAAEASANVDAANAKHVASSTLVSEGEGALAAAQDRLAKLESLTDEERQAAAAAALDVAGMQLESARSALDDARQESTQALAMYEAAVVALDSASQSAAAAFDGKRIASEKANAAASEESKKAQELDSARSKKAHADKIAEERAVLLSSAIEAKAAADAELTRAKSAKDAADEELSAALKAESNAKTAAERAQANLAAGIYAFLDFIGCSDGTAIIDSCRYASLNDVGNTKDATSLRSLKTSATYIRECNALRAAHGLEPLKVSPVLLAMAAADANFSDTEIDHAQQFSVGENVAWNYGSDPFKQWYDEEKADYERTGNRSQAGHYFNIISSSYTTTGFATCYKGTTNRWHTYAQVFHSGSFYDQGAMTVDDFEAAVNAFIAAQENAPAAYERAEAAANAAQQEADDATATLSDASTKADAASAAVQQSQRASDDAGSVAWLASKEVQFATESYNAAHESLEASAHELEKATRLLAEAQDYEGACALGAESAWRALEEAKSALAVAEAAVADAEVGEADARYAIEHVDDAVDEARAAVAAAQENLANVQGVSIADSAALALAQQALADAEADLAAAQDRAALAETSYTGALQVRTETASVVQAARAKVDLLTGIKASVESCRLALTAAAESEGQATLTHDGATAKLASAERALSLMAASLDESRAAVILAKMDLERFATQGARPATTSNVTTTMSFAQSAATTAAIEGGSSSASGESGELDTTRSIAPTPAEFLNTIDAMPESAKVIGRDVVQAPVTQAPMSEVVAMVDRVLAGKGEDHAFDPLALELAAGFVGAVAVGGIATTARKRG